MIWTVRFRPAPARLHTELDQATELEVGDPAELGSLYSRMRERLSHINVLGGCCGTDHRPIRAICIRAFLRERADQSANPRAGRGLSERVVELAAGRTRSRSVSRCSSIRSPARCPT